MAVVVQERLSRFEHQPKEAGRVVLTARDMEILRCVYRHRFLRSDQIASLVAGSPQQLLRRLQLLYHHGYLERPRCQIDYYAQGGGSRRMIYGIGNRGAATLHRLEPSLPRHFDWSQKNASVKRLFLEHALLVSEVMVALELAARERPDLRLISEEELLKEQQGADSASCAASDRFHWRVDLGSRTTIGVVPDRVFALEYRDRNLRVARVTFFLEADRAKMPVSRHSLHQSSFFRKLLVYEATWAQNLHRLRLGVNRFRVLTVTSSPERAEHLAQAAAQLERGHGLFLFSDIASLREHADPCTLPWLSAHPRRTSSLLS